MKLATAIGRAMDAVRSSNPHAATRLIQEALRGSGYPETQAPHPSSPALHIPQAPERDLGGYRSYNPRRRVGLAETIAALRAFKMPQGLKTPLSETPLPESPAFARRSFACASGQRDFRLFIPSSGKPRGLIVMLHGCRQTPEDFAIGTNMNAVAQEHDLLVAYPHQPSSANPMSCWNWFRPQDQARLGGEAEIIAGLTKSLRAEFDIPQESVFLAGLSAGGAMAAILGSTYPDLFSAVGIHSGLAYKSAHDMKSAFAAMGGQHGPRRNGSADYGFRPRLVIFHGSGDQTVAPANARQLWEDAVRSKGAGETLELRVSSGGRTVDRRIFTASAGAGAVEEWFIHGSGHAWSGGNPTGSFTDAHGPNASTEMVRFFLAEGPAAPAGGKS